MGAFLLAAAVAHAADLKTFKDWVVGCDNGLLCQASAMMPESDVSVTLTVRRAPQGNAAPQVWLRSLDTDPVDVSADGKRLGIHLKKNDDDAMVVDPADAVRLLDALRVAKSVEALDAAGKPVGNVLVDGASAAMLYMDEQQHRIGTVGALVRRGDKPDSSVPAPPALPVIDTVRGSAKPPAKLSPAFVARVRKANDCPDEHDPNLVSEDRLDATHTFATITLLCQSGAYNYISAAYVITDGQAPRDAAFDDDKDRQEGDTLHYNLGWVPAERRLSAFFKGRGIGDCGGRQEYAWDGARLRRVKLEEMDDCRGVVDFISAWRARVVER